MKQLRLSESMRQRCGASASATTSSRSRYGLSYLRSTRTLAWPQKLSAHKALSKKMDLQIILLLVAALLIAIALSQPLADRLGLPSTVVLALVGIAIGLTSMYLVRAEGLGRFASVAKVI